MVENPAPSPKKSLISRTKSARASAVAETPATRRILRIGGILFGMAYGLSFALLVWGRDGLLLARSSSEWPWLHLGMGLPAALLLGGFAGWVASLIASVGWSVFVWILSSAVLGWLAAHLPCEGATFVAGLLDPRVAGLPLVPFTTYHAWSMGVVIGGLALIGLALGLAQPNAVEGFWDRLGLQAREEHSALRLLFSPKALPLAFWGVPLALVAALLVVLMFNSYRTAPPQAVAQLIEAMLAGGEAQVQAEGLNTYVAHRYGARFTPVYTQHFNDPYRSTDTVYTIYMDTAFDNGFVLRCSVVSGSLSSCDDVSQLYPVWMESLVVGGRAGTQPWKELPQQLRVEPAAEEALRQGRDALAGEFTVQRAAQRGGILWLEARFSSGAVLSCRFRGIYPTAVEACDLR